MKKTENQKYWSQKVSEFKTSGKSKEEWCKKQGISHRQFNYWLRQFPVKEAPTQWMPVEIKVEANKPDTPLAVKIGAATVEVQPGFDKNHLSDVLKVLKSL